MKRFIETCIFGLIALLLICTPVLFSACDKEEKVDPDQNDTLPPFKPTYVSPQIPDGFPTMEIPDDNPLTAEGIALGKKLFFDPILSGDSTQSCADCHKPEHAFSDDRRFSLGITGAIGTRQAPPIINAGWMKKLFWDGRVSSLEEQALHPVENPDEMAASWEEVVRRLQHHPTYPKLFYRAFGITKITRDHVVKAIAQFERTLISGNSRFDLALQGKIFLSPLEQDGYDLFYSERGDCFHCHSGLLFTDNDFHNNALDSVPTDLGLEKITGKPSDRGKFKTPTLRNIEHTAPYMHDGRFATLEEVIDFYSEGLQYSTYADPLMKALPQGGKHFTPYEKKALIAFLKTLTDTSFLNNPEFLPE